MLLAWFTHPVVVPPSAGVNTPADLCYTRPETSSVTNLCRIKYIVWKYLIWNTPVFAVSIVYYIIPPVFNINAQNN